MRLDAQIADTAPRWAVTLTAVDICIAESGKPLLMKIATVRGEKGTSDEVLGLRILQDNTRAVASW